MMSYEEVLTIFDENSKESSEHFREFIKENAVEILKEVVVKKMSQPEALVFIAKVAYEAGQNKIQ